jgi:hypothetical protein
MLKGLYDFLMDDCVIWGVDRKSEARRLGILAVGEQAATPGPRDCDRFGAKFEINVIFTTWLGTQAALHTASQWACRLGARIVLWFPQAVPRQFSMTAPPVSTAFMERRLQSLAACCENLEIVIRICLCRDGEQCLLTVLEPDSIVLVGGKRRWLRTQEQKLANLLRSYGHRVVFIPAKENIPATYLASERKLI